MCSEETGRGPLETLGIRLRRARPCLLSMVIETVQGVEDYHEFKSLVQDYLPEQEQEIMEAGSVFDMMQAFAIEFSSRYFPLADWLDDPDNDFSSLLRYIPIEVRGLEYDDYHYLNDNKLGVILASLLVDFEAEESMQGDGIRITLMEEAAKSVSQELLQRSRPYSLDFLKEVLIDPSSDERQKPFPNLKKFLVKMPYEGLLWHAKWLCHSTDNPFYDATYEDILNYPPEWCREEVDYLTKQWKEAEVIQEKQDSFYNWLEEKPEERFAHVIEYLERRSCE